MFSLDPSTGSLIVPLWVSAIVLAALVVMTIFAIARSGAARPVLALIGIAALGYVGWAGWALLERSAASERRAERQAFEQRVAALAAGTRAPGTALSCLEGLAGEQVETACERAVFATPDSVANAVTFVAAEVALLTDVRDAAQRNDVNYEAIIAPVRRGLETDRYGIVAHVMLQGENCSADQCAALAMLHDANRVRSNLREKPFNALVNKYASGWANARLGPPVAELSRIAPTPPGGPSGVPVSSKYDFPSSSSIPPVNIMGSEPATPPPPAAANAPPAAASPPTSAAVAEPAPVPRGRPPAAARPPAARPPTARAPTGAPPLAPPQQVPPVPEPTPQQQ
jgi:hypothetical protein